MDERHEIDPKTGFMVHKETGQPVGLFEAPPKEFHVNRLDGSVTVLVANEDEEKADMSAPA